MDDNTDTVIYAFNKMVNLLLSYNPNTIELLGLAPYNYLYLNDIVKMLFDNKRLFLSKKLFSHLEGMRMRNLEDYRTHLPETHFHKVKNIRFGKYQTDEGTFSDSFYDMMREYEKKLHCASEHTDLEDKLDYKRVQELVMTINERVICDK